MSEQSADEHAPLLVQTTAIFGPFPLGDPDLGPLVGKAIVVLSSAGVNMLRAKPRTDPAADAARRITGLTVLLAAGEAAPRLFL